jgi:hypothetical protein
MCTVTWVREAGDGYTLCISRDEKRMRAASSAPSIHVANGVCFLAPLDGERGGSWAAVNELGLSICLLNRSRDEPRTSSHGQSRGEVVMRLASSRDRDEAARRLREWDLTQYQPFTVACLEAGQPAFVVDWTGSAVRGDFEAEERCPLVSSSMSMEAAWMAKRRLFERFRAGGLTKDSLLEFHASHDPERGALSPCMHREDAVTVSFTVVTVTSSEARMEYQPGAPCEGGPVCRKTLPRSAGRNVQAA